jgi:hypothetical protein
MREIFNPGWLGFSRISDSQAGWKMLKRLFSIDWADGESMALQKKLSRMKTGNPHFLTP